MTLKKKKLKKSTKLRAETFTFKLIGNFEDLLMFLGKGYGKRKFFANAKTRVKLLNCKSADGFYLFSPENINFVQIKNSLPDDQLKMQCTRLNEKELADAAVRAAKFDELRKSASLGRYLVTKEDNDKFNKKLQVLKRWLRGIVKTWKERHEYTGVIPLSNEEQRLLDEGRKLTKSFEVLKKTDEKQTN